MGMPRATSVIAWPTPHHAPSRAAERAARSRPDATSVVIAARWSGSVAWRRPRSVATRRTTPIDAPFERPAIQSSSPNMTLVRRARRIGSSDDAGKCPRRDHEADDEDERRADRWERPDEASLERDAPERAPGKNGHEADRRDRDREPEAERDDEREAQADAVQRDRGQEDDESRRARQQPGGDADPEDSPRGEPVLVVVMVMPVGMIVSAVRVMDSSVRADTLPEHGRADEHDQQPRREREPGIELLRDDERRQPERDEAECEHARRVRDRHGPAEQERMPRRAFRPDEVCRHQRLAVSRSERVGRPPERG